MLAKIWLCASYFVENFCIKLRIRESISNIQGMPCIVKSNQSTARIPSVPDKIHLSFSQTCGSGVKGAKPRVMASTNHNPGLNINLFLFGTKAG